MPRALLNQIQLQLPVLVVSFLLLLLLPNICWQNFVTADNLESKAHNGDLFPALEEFSTHTVIRPQVNHGRTKRSIQSTLDATDGLHAPHITLTYTHNGERVHVDLQRNDLLLPATHFLRYQNGTSHVVQKNFTMPELDLCHYQGHIRGRKESRVALSTCNGGLNGVVFDGTETYFIHPHAAGSGRLLDDHYLLRHADMWGQNATCGYNHHTDDVMEKESSLPHMEIPHHIDGSEFQHIFRRKRETDESKSIHGPYNSNKYSSYVELVIVVDNKVFKHFNENTKKVHQHCKDLANIVNALYEPLNIFVALVGVVIWNELNEIELSSDGDVTLHNFLNYRRTKLALEHPNDNAQLLTKEAFSGGVVGKALKGPICTYEFSGGVSMQHSQVLAVVATTMAHEMGHNFGMEHDSSDCKCEDEKCIMSASSTSVVPVHWSSCSIDQLTIAFSRGMNYCLRNKPEKLFDSPQCGNGFVEHGEQCDCGLPAHCKNTCCNPHTCMLHTNASCATGECCDLNTCLPKVAGTECRDADNECDLPEYCTGESEYCPSDVYRRDTEPCEDGEAYCYLGSCRSHSNQCRILWGSTGMNSVHCYYKNMEGTRNGNCGYNRLNKTFLPCEHSNVNCGMLHCIHLNERLEFGMESAAELASSFVSYDRKIVACRSALVDLGLQSTDPGLAPNGAKCGADHMCIDQKCLPVDRVRQSGKGASCPNDCSGRGVCNSRGRCHCEIGFGGDSCQKPGFGGSPDSGPATDPNANEGFQRFLYILFFLVVPIVFFCWLTYHCRQNKFFAGGRLADNIWKTASGSKQPPARPAANGTGPPPGAALPKSTPSSTDDMNSALLKSPSDGSDPAGTAGMFGKFKGFTLRPLNDATSPGSNYSGPNVAFVQPTLQENGVPQRAAPPPPTVAPKASPEHVDTWQRRAPEPPSSAAKGPALPPPNPGSTARPIISEPVLDSSTVTMVPLKGSASDLSPSRTAPTTPMGTLKPAPPPPVPLHMDPKLNVKRDGTIRRLASFLKKEEKPPLKEKTYIDRERLRTLEISAPLPVPTTTTPTSSVPGHTESSNSDSETTPREEETKNLVKRTQSMRSPTKKPQVQTFGSMRSPNGPPRPKSIVTGGGTASRPKSPPPRPPPLQKTNSITSSGYQRPVATAKSTLENTYDDCESVEVAATPSRDADNIYSVIDEIPPAAKTLKRSDLVSMQSNNSDMGLLGEIVNEFEKLNGDSIYSGSALVKPATTPAESEPPKSPQRPAPPKPAKSSLDEKTAPVVATADPPPTVTPTYLRPAPVNAPVARVAPTRSDVSPSRAFSSFKPAPAGIKPSSTTATVVRSTSSSTTTARPKSFTRTATKPLPNGTAGSSTVAPPSATIQKPKPLSAKPSFSGGGSGGGMGKRGTGTAPTATPLPPTIKASNIASLTKRFEQRN